MRHDRRTWGHAAAWSLGGLTLLELAALLVLLALNASRVGAARLISDALLAVAIGLGAAVGQLIISRRPRNAVGWLLGLAGLSLAGSMFTEQYALQGLAIVHVRHGPAVIQASLPAARLAGWAADVLASVTVLLLLFVLPLFPDGRLPSRRWRPVLWAMFVVAVSWTVGQFHGNSTVTGGITNALSGAAALFTPLRSRVQQRVDHRFNRARYNADQTVTAFAARLKDAVDQDAVRAGLLGVVLRSLEPTHATVWVRPIR